MVLLNDSGTTDRGTPVERSQTRVVFDAGMGTLLSCRGERGEKDRSVERSGSSVCAFAMATKSMLWFLRSALISTRDSALATGLLVPLKGGDMPSIPKYFIA